MAVHNHGPAEGRGLDCGEAMVNGNLLGWCMREDAFCAEPLCETLMVPTPAGHMCPRHDWHDVCSIDTCGFDPEADEDCGLRAGVLVTQIWRKP